MRLVIPGAAGFVGANLVEYIFSNKQVLSAFDKIILIDLLPYGKQKISNKILKHKKFRFIQDSIYNDYILDEYIAKNDIIIHLAVEENTFSNPQDQFSPGINNYLKNLVNKKVGKFIFLSSADVYGVNNSDNLVETDVIRPTTIYAANKIALEACLQVYHSLFNLPVIIFRPVTVYGPKQHPGWLIPRVITKAMANQKIQITGNGSVKRDWIFVSDVCQILIKACFSDRNNIYGEVFNLGTGLEKSVLEVTRYILKKVGKSESLIEFVQPRPGDIPRQITLATKARRTFNWSPQVNLYPGLIKTITWYRDNYKP